MVDVEVVLAPPRELPTAELEVELVGEAVEVLVNLCKICGKIGLEKK